LRETCGRMSRTPRRGMERGWAHHGVQPGTGVSDPPRLDRHRPGLVADRARPRPSGDAPMDPARHPGACGVSGTGAARADGLPAPAEVRPAAPAAAADSPGKLARMTSSHLDAPDRTGLADAEQAPADPVREAVRDAAVRARAASRELALLTADKKNAVLLAAAEALVAEE